MTTRADLILEILKENEGRLNVSDILTKLSIKEGINKDDFNSSLISSTVRQDNRTRNNKGLAKRFKFYGDGEEERGFVSLIEQVSSIGNKKQILDNPNIQIPALIEAANKKIKDQLKMAISKLSWREFESSFLTQILDALGFEDIQITQPTRDGGKDAYCTYRRGLVTSEAIVSAKHWKEKVIDASEVQRLRGIKGSSDTGIIVTSSTFSDNALTEASPSQNQRAMVLIDGNLIVDTCFEKQIGVKIVSIQNLYELDKLNFNEEIK